MTEIITSFADISRDYDAVLCDLWGCYHNGIRAYPQAVAALEAYRAEGGLVAMFTNAPRPNASAKAQLARMGGSEASYDIIVSSGDATIIGMRGGAFGQSCHFIGMEKDLVLLDGLGIEQAPLETADFILCAGLFDDRSETPEDYAALYAAGIERGLKFVCANPDIHVDRGEERIYCAGALAAEYARRGGSSVYFGKPHAPIYELAFARLEALRGAALDKSRVLGIGDGPLTDIPGAAGYGIDALFIAGGLASEAVLDTAGAIDPARLNAFLTANDVAPQKTLAFLS